jgi:hypothetical protein
MVPTENTYTYRHEALQAALNYVEKRTLIAPLSV